MMLESYVLQLLCVQKVLKEASVQDTVKKKFYEELSNKALPKPRHSSSHEDDLAQRLGAKLPQAAEQKRNLQARARMLQARKVTKSVAHQREIERRKMKDKLEDRLQRAKRKRAQYLSPRGRLHNSNRVNWNKMHREAELLSQKLARCWRQFLQLNKTTLDLAKAYNALNINDKCVKSMPFEKLALLIESPATRQTVKALLDRLENRYKLSKPVFITSNPSSLGWH